MDDYAVGCLYNCTTLQLYNGIISEETRDNLDTFEKNKIEQGKWRN